MGSVVTDNNNERISELGTEVESLNDEIRAWNRRAAALYGRISDAADAADLETVIRLRAERDAIPEIVAALRNRRDARHTARSKLIEQKMRDETPVMLPLTPYPAVWPKSRLGRVENGG